MTNFFIWYIRIDTPEAIRVKPKSVFLTISVTPRLSTGTSQFPQLIRMVMKWRISLLLILVSQNLPHAQNLIPNPSFERGDCPIGFTKEGDVYFADAWFPIDVGTPDRYSACGTKGAGFTENWSGGAFPAHGEAFVGIYLWKGRSYQENIGVQLLGPLEAGVIYHGQFYLAGALNAEFLPTEISIRFGKEKMTVDLTGSYDHRQLRLPIAYQEVNNGWLLGTFKYKAEGGEQYMFIGPLQNKAYQKVPSSFRLRPEPMLNQAAYIYLDDFYLGLEPRKQQQGELEDTPEEVTEVAPDTLSLYFDFDKYDISSGDLRKLDSLATKWQNEMPSIKVVGATDSKGTEEYNYQLGLKRAKAVKHYFESIGLLGNILTESKGEVRPNATNETDQGRSRNRNAYILIFLEND